MFGQCGGLKKNTPDPDFSGNAVFTYKASDGALESNRATVTISVTAVNDTPAAADDAYDVNQDSSITVSAPGVLSNDSDADSDPLTAVLVSDVSNGALALNADGSFDYAPFGGYSGPDSFSYQADDGSVTRNTAVVSINVIVAANEPLVANSDRAITSRNTPIDINVVANDTDVDGTIDPTTVVITTQALRGTAVSNADGTVTYTPGLGFRRSDAFAYSVDDNDGATSNIATVRVRVVR